MRLPSLYALDDTDLPLERRLTLALEFAITAMNAAPSFQTRIPSPENGRPLSSYRLLTRLDPVLRHAQQTLDRQEREASCVPIR